MFFNYIYKKQSKVNRTHQGRLFTHFAKHSFSRQVKSIVIKGFTKTVKMKTLYLQCFIEIRQAKSL